jgi:putative membrane protein
MVTATTLAEHSWDGPGPWWPLFPLLWLALIVAVFLVVTRFGRRRLQRGSYAGESRLAERFAAGEIDAVEYREKLAVLHERDR